MQVRLFVNLCTLPLPCASTPFPQHRGGCLGLSNVTERVLAQERGMVCARLVYSLPQEATHHQEREVVLGFRSAEIVTLLSCHGCLAEVVLRFCPAIVFWKVVGVLVQLKFCREDFSGGINLGVFSLHAINFEGHLYLRCPKGQLNPSPPLLPPLNPRSRLRCLGAPPRPSD